MQHYSWPFSVIVKLLALALTNLVFGLANMVINLVKQSLGQPRHQPDQNLALILTTLGPGVDTIIKQATPPHPTPPPLNFSKVETWNSYSLTAQNFKGKTSLIL